MDVLLLRFDAPLMSFGGVAVDELRRTDGVPGRSMLAGLLGNALGYDHADTDQLQSLQGRIRHAVRTPLTLTRVVDYQTVDLGQPHMTKAVAWTSRGAIEERGGGSPEGTHIRYRHFLVECVVDVALTLSGEGHPTVADLEVALRRPARPLFIGRKCAIPSRPVLEGRVSATSLSGALEAWTPDGRRGVTPTDDRPAYLLWSDSEGPTRPHAVCLSDERDWANQQHFGQRWMCAEVTRWRV